MSNNPTPSERLEDLRRRLDRSQEVVVDQNGSLLIPEEIQKAESPPPGKKIERTRLKMQRWFNQPWYRTNPARMILEQRAMRARFPQFELRDDRGQLLWLGTLTTNRGNKYQIAIYYPDNFPSEAPKVYPLNPPITVWKDRRAGELMHQFNDSCLCLFHPDDRFFQSNTTAATIVATAAAWFFAYETWLETRVWPGEEAEHISQ